MPPLPLPAPPPLVAPAQGSRQAEAALLAAFDWGRPLPPAPKLKGEGALSLRWLRAAASFDPAHGLPANPFAAGQGRDEAQALRRLLQAPPAQIGSQLKALSLREPGTALALWRWGRLLARRGAMDAALRRTWEDRLLAEGPALTRGYALRHALCWALAEHDEGRLAGLRAAAGGSQETVSGFQRLFGLLGGPSPVLRLWALPSLEYHDLRLDQLGADRIWICPFEEGAVPKIPAGTAWIIPTALAAGLDEREASLSEGALTEGQALAARLTAASSAHFAPSRSAFEHLGLVWFPILVELDGQGAIRGIRMGDAAPTGP